MGGKEKVGGTEKVDGKEEVEEILAGEKVEGFQAKTVPLER